MPISSLEAQSNVESREIWWTAACDSGHPNRIIPATLRYIIRPLEDSKLLKFVPSRVYGFHRKPGGS
ncbi:hypothetical protein RSOLAG1IB_05179 [Rhizoctonia solani AG-1 IB]|uniref:Uncharacterized protein n=1 Tax=Thanatephorus cucumeris (strain AG1-IB / isolate 7/3/14) TaxID=1108050 RepID=A0A0B7G230_THACB|nr:hypothetical protein RSOLAG1IB_05179 [Rhizoctonia solani AG-1 IB]